MSFNHSITSCNKCNLIVIGNLAVCPKYTLALHEILKTDTVKDLGVYVDHKLNFKTHIEDIVLFELSNDLSLFLEALSR